MSDRLKMGDSAPGFRLKDQNGLPVSLSDFTGGKLLLYFYPKADTPGCTVQACSVRESFPALAELGVAVVGISPDPSDVLKAFDIGHRLGFPLLADEDHGVAEAYGVWSEKKRNDITYMGILRSAFLIDEKGWIEALWLPVRPEEMVPQVIRKLSPG